MKLSCAPTEDKDTFGLNSIALFLFLFFILKEIKTNKFVCVIQCCTAGVQKNKAENCKNVHRFFRIILHKIHVLWQQQGLIEQFHI